MIRRRLREESGSTLVEVMVSIIILTIAILPMVGMFDMAVNSATTSSLYDKARTLANLKMEQAKSLPFADVENDYPVTGTTYNGSGYYDSGWQTDVGQTYWDENFASSNFQYKVEKQYMTQPPQTPGSSTQTFGTSNSATNLIRITITVQWGNGKTYKTFGLVT